MATAAEITKALNKAHGAYIVRAKDMRGGVGRHLPTGVFELDMGLHGGWPESAISLIYGRPGCGKSLVVYKSIASAQKFYPEETAVLLDPENSFDPVWAARHGVDPDRMLLIRGETGEITLDTAMELLRADDVSIVCLDSIATIEPGKTQEASLEDGTPAVPARLVNAFIRKANAALGSQALRGGHKVLLLVNQIRARFVQHGDPRVLPGGEAQNFMSAIKLEMQSPKITMGKDDKGRPVHEVQECQFKITKDKRGAADPTGSFKLVKNPSNPMGQGAIDDALAVVEVAKLEGLLTGGPGKYALPGCEETFRTHLLAAGWLQESPEFADKLKVELISLYREACGLSRTGWLPGGEPK